jgi:transportin-3
MHLFIVDAVAMVVSKLPDETFSANLEQLVTPLVTGLNSEREKPQVLSEILDRLQAIIRLIDPGSDTQSIKSVQVGTLINNHFWPLIRQTLASHPGDPKVVEKSCRLLKHSMRCVPSLFKVNVQGVAQTLVTAFSSHQHSSYLYSAEILANTYASDPEIIPVLTELFHNLSSTALQRLHASLGQLEEITELVEDFYGMFERYLRYAPMIVLNAPTLLPTLALWDKVIFVQQNDAIEAVIAFIEAVLRHCADGKGYREQLGPQVIQVCPGFVDAIFRLIAQVPTRYVQEALPCVLECVRKAFFQEFPTWVQAAMQHLPPSAASQAERAKLGEQIVRGDDTQIYEAVQDLCYRCEQVALRSRGSQKK